MYVYVYALIRRRSQDQIMWKRSRYFHDLPKHGKYILKAVIEFTRELASPGCIYPKSGHMLVVIYPKHGKQLSALVVLCCLRELIANHFPRLA
jgi:hypothetical protein